MRVSSKTCFMTLRRFLPPAAAAFAGAALLAWAGLTGCQGPDPVTRAGENSRAGSASLPAHRPGGLSRALKWWLEGDAAPPPPGVRVEAVGGGGVAVSTIRLFSKADGLWVRGSLERAGLGNGYGHLDLWLLDGQGQTLLARRASFLPNPVPHLNSRFRERSHFVAALGPAPAGLAVVRVRFHGAGEGSCAL